jgi:hypothetical protein
LVLVGVPDGDNVAYVSKRLWLTGHKPLRDQVAEIKAGDDHRRHHRKDLR